MLKHGHILNCPYTPADDIIAHDIFGPDVATIRGRSLRPSQHKIPLLNLIDVPKELRAIYKNVRLFIDVLYVNRIPFLHTISETLGVRTS